MREHSGKIAIQLRGQRIEYFAILVRRGDLTFQDALRQFAQHEMEIADAYRKLAEEAIGTSFGPIFLEKE